MSPDSDKLSKSIDATHRDAMPIADTIKVRREDGTVIDVPLTAAEKIQLGEIAEKQRILEQHAKRKTKPNAPCPCGSGKKFKKCCFHEINERDQLMRQTIAAKKTLSHLNDQINEALGETHSEETSQHQSAAG